MCLGIPGEIVDVLDGSNDLAVADVAGVRRRVNVGLLSEEGVRPGDWVLIHVGFAMAKIDEEEARSALRMLEDMGDPFRDELETLERSEIE